MDKEWRIAFGYAHNRKKMLSPSQTPEDFAQYHCLKKFENDSRSIKFTFIDYLRSCSGRKGNDGSFNQSRMSIDSATQYIDWLDIREHVGNGEAYNNSSRGFGNIENAIKTRPIKDRLILSLFFEYGFTQKEIADMCRVTESRICQIIQGIQSSLYASLKTKPSIQGKAKETMESVLSKETRTICWDLECFESQGLETGEPW